MKGLREKDSLLTVTILNRCSLFVLFILVCGCQHPDRNKLPQGDSFGKIIYDTAIINRDSTDAWGAECLAGLNRKVLVDKIFESVLEGKITPYDYFTGVKISPLKIRDMEATGEFSRENISKIKFEERWIWDSEKVEMQKQLISMTIAYEVYDNTGASRGQKPLFKLVFLK